MGHNGECFAVAFRRQLRQASTRLMGSQLALANRIDVGSVHALRVAIRRARALLWSARPWLIRRRYESCLTHLKWLSSGLGPLRDIDVIARLLRDPVASHAQLNSAQRHALATNIGRARRELRQTLWGRQGCAGAAARTRLVCRLLRSPQLLRRKVPDTLAPWRRRILHAVRRCERRLRKARATELHRLRVRAKQCRYALEALDERAPAATLLELRRMQRVLGRYVDLQLAAAWCETRAAGELDRKLRRRIRRSARSLARRQVRAVVACSAHNPNG